MDQCVAVKLVTLNDGSFGIIGIDRDSVKFAMISQNTPQNKIQAQIVDVVQGESSQVHHFPQQKRKAIKFCDRANCHLLCAYVCGDGRAYLIKVENGLGYNDGPVTRIFELPKHIKMAFASQFASRDWDGLMILAGGAVYCAGDSDGRLFVDRLDLAGGRASYLAETIADAGTATGEPARISVFMASAQDSAQFFGHDGNRKGMLWKSRLTRFNGSPNHLFCLEFQRKVKHYNKIWELIVVQTRKQSFLFCDVFCGNVEDVQGASFSPGPKFAVAVVDGEMRIHHSFAKTQVFQTRIQSENITRISVMAGVRVEGQGRYAVQRFVVERRGELWTVAEDWESSSEFACVGRWKRQLEDSERWDYCINVVSMCTTDNSFACNSVVKFKLRKIAQFRIIQRDCKINGDSYRIFVFW